MATDTTNVPAQGMADAAGQAAQTPGMPQLDFSTFGNQIFWLIVALVAIYMLLSRVALPRIQAILAERQGTIANDIAKSEAFKAKALEAEEAYQKALIDARAEAQRIVGEAKAEIQQELDAAIAAADQEIMAKAAESEKAIAEIRAGAKAAVQEVANDTAAEIVAAMGSRSSASAIEDAVAEKMKG